MFFFKKFLTFFILIFSGKVSLSLPTKSEVVIFDRPGYYFFKKLFNKKKVTILYARNEIIYLRILLKAFLKHLLRFNLFFYYVEYLKYVNPKFCITFIDNSNIFYLFKSYVPKIKFISFQNGIRSNHNDIYRLAKSKYYKNFKVDYLFCFGKLIEKYLIKSIKILNESFSLGSIKNNSVKIQKNKKKGIIYISEYRKKNKFPTKEENIIFSNLVFWRYPDLNVLKNLNQFCKENRIKLFIKGSITDYKQELNFYLNNIKDLKAKFIPFNPNSNPYKLIDKFELVVFVTSTLGYESLSRGNKSISFSGIRERFVYKNSSYDKKIKVGYKFGWPGNYKFNGLCWSDKESYSDFKKAINLILNVSKRKWNNFIKKYNQEILFYDEDNYKIKKKIEKILY